MTALAQNIEAAIRKTIPPEQLKAVVANIGQPISGINTAYGNSGTIGTEDADVLVTLNEEHPPTEGYVRKLRSTLPTLFPGVTFSFLPADIVSQILNFGSPAPIDVQISGPNLEANHAFANKMLARMRWRNGTCRRANPAGVSATDPECRVQPDDGEPRRSQRAERGEQHAGDAGRERADQSDILAQSG